jgi:hypothetical protein
LVLAHFSVDAYWWTKAVVLNPAAEDVTVTLTAYGDSSGVVIDERSYTVPARGRIVEDAENLLPGILTSPDTTGWILVQAPPGELIGACAMLGDRISTPGRFAAALAVPAASTTSWANFKSDEDWWTGIALVNPGPVAGDVTLTAYGPGGNVLQRVTRPVGPLGKTFGFARSLLGLTGNARGWIEAASTSPMIGIQVLHADDDARRTWGLAGLASQQAAPKVYFDHYHASSPWWTLLAMANSSGTNEADVTLKAFGDDGAPAGWAYAHILEKGPWAEGAGAAFAQ